MNQFVGVMMMPYFLAWSRLVLLAFAVTTFCPSSAISQTLERLFCAECGNQNVILSKFCSQCGTLLDKRALIDRLQQRLAEADSLDRPLTLTAAEIRVLMQSESDRKSDLMKHQIELRRNKPRTEVEKLVDVLAPMAIGVGALYFISLIAGFGSR